MDLQPSLNPEMRAVLIDWLVEVQVSCVDVCFSYELDELAGNHTEQNTSC